MRLPRRRFLGLAAGAAMLPAVSRIARAQAYPTRPVRIIAGYPPGGGSDILARLMGQWLSERLNQAFVVENRPGAGANIATETVVRAPADGYTLLLCGAFSASTGYFCSVAAFAVHRDFTKRHFGGHPTCRCSLFLVKRRAGRRASPILQATGRADLPSTAHLGIREFP